jgi:hypothetical protein
MSRKVALILASSALVSSISFNVEVLPVLSVSAQTPAPDITLVRGFCGWGFHRGPYGHCIRNGTVYAPPVVVVPPVVVAPHYAPPVVVAPAVCPYGYYLGPYGRCLPY